MTYPYRYETVNPGLNVMLKQNHQKPYLIGLTFDRCNGFPYLPLAKRRAGFATFQLLKSARLFAYFTITLEKSSWLEMQLLIRPRM